jgi:hypothetical protein
MAAAPEEVQAWLSQYEVEGKALGKKGDALRKYVENCLREERAARREQEREIALRERELAAEKEKELALKKQELDAMHDIEMRKLNIEEEKVRNDSKARANELQEKEAKHKLANRPKIPYFDDKTDDIESYLYRFDKHAVSLKWSSEDKALILPSLLRGRALNYYQELPVEDSNDYAKLSAHLLKKFRCTEEGFRTQFRSCKPESGETLHVFFSRLKRYFMRWTDMAEVGNDFK